jgi:hypothetical protein
MPIKRPHQHLANVGYDEAKVKICAHENDKQDILMLPQQIPDPAAEHG